LNELACAVGGLTEAHDSHVSQRIPQRKKVLDSTARRERGERHCPVVQPFNDGGGCSGRDSRRLSRGRLQAGDEDCGSGRDESHEALQNRRLRDLADYGDSSRESRHRR